MPVEKPLCEYTVKVYNDSVIVKIKNPEKLNPGKIERLTPFVLREWQKFQQSEVIALRERRRKEAEKDQLVEESDNAA